jgi:branched-chain amino acid transport system permease protein
MWSQLLINAFSLGSFYALLALGFALIFGVTHAFNLAHGEMILLSGYLAYSLSKFLDVPFLWTLPVCMFTLLFVALLLHNLLRHVRDPFELNTLVLTFGLALVLQNGMLFFFSADYHLISTSRSSFELPLFHIFFSETQVLLILLSLLATTVLYLVLKKTFLGKALRATIQDREVAELAGIHIGHMRLTAFGIGGILIGLAGPLFGRTAYLHPSGGMEATLIAIIITIFAGIGRIKGILIGGWILGVVETLTIYFGGSSWRELVSALLLILILLWRPEGVLSRRTRLVP